MMCLSIQCCVTAGAFLFLSSVGTANAALDHDHEVDPLHLSEHDHDRACPSPAPLKGEVHYDKSGTPDSEPMASVAEHAHEHHGMEHDHARDLVPAAQKSGLPRWIGMLHPLVVHFPIALILAAALGEIMAIASKRQLFRDASHFCLTLGAAGALVAAPTGWANAYGAEHRAMLASIPVVEIHRWLGTATAILTIAALYLSWRVRQAAQTSLRPMYAAMLFLTAILVTFSGHFGAALVYGLDYFSI